MKLKHIDLVKVIDSRNKKLIKVLEFIIHVCVFHFKVSEKFPVVMWVTII